MAATVTLHEDFQGGCTVNELASFGARAVALGLGGYDVRVVPVLPNGTNLLSDANALRQIEALEVTGPAPDLR